MAHGISPSAYNKILALIIKDVVQQARSIGGNTIWLYEYSSSLGKPWPSEFLKFYLVVNGAR